MDEGQPTHSWFGPLPGATAAEVTEDSGEFIRLWQGFMTARVTLGVVLIILQTTLMVIQATHSLAALGISAAYAGGALAARLVAKPRPLANAFDLQWMGLVGVDVLVFLALQAVQGSNINYTPLCVLPILLTSVLGTIRLALGTAAGITVLLLGGTLWAHLDTPGDATAPLAQSALGGAGYFVVALLANQLSNRLAREGQRARSSQFAARIQRQVNELVIESLPDGVLIVDDTGCVRAANPAARALLGTQRALHAAVFYLKEEPGWAPLLTLTRLSIGTGTTQEQEVSIRHDALGPRRVRARTRLASAQDSGSESLCVLFLQDQRELEARIRTDKLASMGRMSSAVAHEIRNPLAAIAQANALLDEDLTDPRLKTLTAMVGQNAKRLDRIVEDILNVARVQPDDQQHPPASLLLTDWVPQICRDWANQSGCQQQLSTQLSGNAVAVRFDPDHLRRVLVNLLDNARRYATKDENAVRVSSFADGEQVLLSVWSNGAPMDRSIERHLFEPFFSSESRSTGLGLYICRELCQRYGASITYQRNVLLADDGPHEGNEFTISLRRAGAPQSSLLEQASTSL
ncbi:MAG: sensor histidine kinase [Rhodoferax sp.]